MRIAVLDDDSADRNLLLEYLERYQNQNDVEIQVKAYCNGMDFLEEYGKGYDVIFLDIEMPGMDGLEVASEIRETDQGAGIIFITNMAQYAIRGYEVNAADFMVKPVGYYNFADKLEKAAAFSGRRREKEIVVSGKESVIRLSISDIWFIEKDKNYLLYHTKKGDFLSRGTMQETKERLSGLAFSECSAGCLVNLHYVERIDRDTVRVADMALPVSRRQKKDFTRDFMDYLGGGI